MRLTSVVVVVGLAALTAIPAAAQKPKEPKVKHVQRAAPVHWEARPIGVYELTFFGAHGASGGTLAIIDSSGALRATLARDGDPEVRPADVAIEATELSLESSTPRGRFAMVLHRKADRIAGRWRGGGGLEGTVYARKLR